MEKIKKEQLKKKLVYVIGKDRKETGRA